MSDIAIRCKGLGKRYRIGERERYKALRDLITDGVASPFRKLRSALSGNGHRGSSPTPGSPAGQLGWGGAVREGAVGSNGNGHLLTSDLRPPTSGSSDYASPFPLTPSSSNDTFWALQNVSFEVKRGEVVGIIGRNGAGKSTLLKILSRITAPTTGEVEIKGRVGSLLEVGTGFHPELTGRENIYLNGAILGMKRAEINHKFDEIVAFAEIEKFIDTPVKRYSSGMYVRLAFAVAAHLEPEILVVDEVLAVGDAQFQKKCLGKMGDVAREGRTVLFVSHSMAAIQRLCSRAALIEGGNLQSIGVTSMVVAEYLSSNEQSFQNSIIPETNGVSLDLKVASVGGLNTPLSGDTLEFHIGIAVRKPIQRAGLGIGITDLQGQRILTLHTHYQCNQGWQIDRSGRFLVSWPNNCLCPGSYLIVISVFEGDVTVAHWPSAGMFTIASSDYFGTGKLPNTSYQGNVLARANWKVLTDNI